MKSRFNTKKVLLYSFIGILGAVTVMNLIMWRKKSGPILLYASTEAVVDRKMVDLKKQKLKSSISGSFKITNTGKNNLFIKDVKTDCHCTVPDWSKEPILPGRSTIIQLRYDSTQPGYFFRTARVNMNTSNSPVVLSIRGEVIP